MTARAWHAGTDGIAQGFVGAAELVDPVVGWHCPQDDVRRDLVRLLLTAVWDGIEFSHRLQPGPCLFLTNHQTALDILLFSYAVSALRQEPINLIGWQGALAMHSGELLTKLASRPEPGSYDLRAHVRSHYVDHRNAAQILSAATRLARDLGATAEPASAAVATEGKRQTGDADPVARVGSSFVDIALAAGVPICPVRFVWGLPEPSVGHRFAWPAGLATQRCIVGAPIMPADLADLNLKERGELVGRAIDRLWRPAPPGHRDLNADRKARLDRIVAMTGMAQTKALLCDLLLVADPQALSAEGRAMRGMLSDPAVLSYKDDDWLYQLALWLSDGFNISHIPLRDLYPRLYESGT